MIAIYALYCTFMRRQRESLAEAVGIRAARSGLIRTTRLLKVSSPTCSSLGTRWAGRAAESDIAIGLAREAPAANRVIPNSPVGTHPLVQFAREYALSLLTCVGPCRLVPIPHTFSVIARTVSTLRDEPTALDYCQRAMRLNPLDPETPIMQMDYGMVLVLVGRDQMACTISIKRS